jgi:hypothetical protein
VRTRARAIVFLSCLAAASTARAEEPATNPCAQCTCIQVDGPDAKDVSPVPYAVPRETLIPGTPGMPGGFHFMVNAFAHAQNVGLGAHRIENAGVEGHPGGATIPLVTDDWVMGYGRDARGYVEGLLMLNLEPLTVGPGGIPELGQSGEGLWDAQHAHQLVHQAMIAVHPLAGLDGWHPVSMMEEGRFDLSLFGGQGSATIGPPIFMHRASSPGPTVPRKHHKGENPHETFPVLGASLRVDATWIEASAFSAKELTPQDSRFHPYVAAPASVAARVRHVFAKSIEVQVSGERLRDQGNGAPDAWQASASVYGWSSPDASWRRDVLLDWALDHDDDGTTAQAALLEYAVRSPSRRDIGWLRSELNQREERDGSVSSPWLFETLGFERVVAHGVAGGAQVGVFAEATVVDIPPSLRGFYGTDVAVTVDVGVHLFGMWMTDGGLHEMKMGR